MPQPFADRRQAGRALAAKLAEYAGRDDVVVLGLPRGGVPVAYEVARALGAPLDVFLVRKLGVPGHEELAFGALGSGGVIVTNPHVVESLGVDEATLRAVVAVEQAELDRREALYRAGRPAVPLAGRTVIVVDDGLATGASMRAAVAALRRRGPRRIVVAVPVAPPEACEALAEEADESICALTPRIFHAVGLWYEDFTQTSDPEVQALLGSASEPLAGE